jgi:predicted cobalt transporter CbtA
MHYSGSDGSHLRSGLPGLVVSEFAKPHSAGAEEQNTLSIPWVVAAALLCGIGVFLVTGALIRLAGGLDDWAWWIGIVPAVAGFFMLMNPRAGSQGRH